MPVQAAVFQISVSIDRVGRAKLCLGAMELFVIENYTVCRTSSTTYTL